MLFTFHENYSIKIHMSKLIPGTNITTIFGAMSLKSPRSFHQLDAFTTRRNLNNLVYLYDIFWNNCLNKQKTNTATTPNVLELSTLNAIMQSTRLNTAKLFITLKSSYIIFYLFHLLYK